MPLNAFDFQADGFISQWQVQTDAERAYAGRLNITISCPTPTPCLWKECNVSAGAPHGAISWNQTIIIYFNNDFHIRWDHQIGKILGNHVPVSVIVTLMGLSFRQNVRCFLIIASLCGFSKFFGNRQKRITNWLIAELPADGSYLLTFSRSYSSDNDVPDGNINYPATA